jgi:hypothetical protein
MTGQLCHTDVLPTPGRCKTQAVHYGRVATRCPVVRVGHGAVPAAGSPRSARPVGPNVRTS